MSQQGRTNRIAYFNCCIQAFAERFRLSATEAYSYLKNFLGMDFLYRFYEAEHTQSIEDAVSDLVMICGRNEGTLA